VAGVGSTSTCTNAHTVHDSMFMNNVDQDLRTRINTVPGLANGFCSLLLYFLCV